MEMVPCVCACARATVSMLAAKVMVMATMSVAMPTKFQFKAISSAKNYELRCFGGPLNKVLFYILKHLPVLGLRVVS